MTVKELMNFLSKQNPDAKVTLTNSEAVLKMMTNLGIMKIMPLN